MADPQGRYHSFDATPGVWDRLDIPDLIAMSAPRPCMVVSGQHDPLFPPQGQREAARQIAEAYTCADAPGNFINYAPEKPHCYDVEIQERALEFFEAHLKCV